MLGREKFKRAGVGIAKGSTQYRRISDTSGASKNSVEKMHRWVKFLIDKTVIGDRKYELKDITYHSESSISGHYKAAVNFKERWWNCNDAVVKRMEEGKVVLDAAYILFYKQIWGCLETSMTDWAFG